MKREMLKKNLDSIRKERNLLGEDIPKLKIGDRTGFLPISIWDCDWRASAQLNKYICDRGDTRKLVKRKNRFSDQLGGSDSPSLFNPRLAWMILSAYCPMDARIYDPFAGGGARAIIAAMMGHKYYGVELRKEEVERIIQVREKLGLAFHIREGNSEYFDFEKESFDFSYTCPPYFDLEVYSDLPGDLSNCKTYSEFLARLDNVIDGVYIGLKKGSFSVWVVANFRDNRGELIHFNGDLVRAVKKRGLALHEEIIFNRTHINNISRLGMFAKNRKAPRVHDYVLVFKKL